LDKRVVPERQNQREEEHQSDLTLHDAIGFAVALKDARGHGHARLLHVIEPGRKNADQKPDTALSPQIICR